MSGPWLSQLGDPASSGSAANSFARRALLKNWFPSATAYNPGVAITKVRWISGGFVATGPTGSLSWAYNGSKWKTGAAVGSTTLYGVCWDAVNNMGVVVGNGALAAPPTIAETLALDTAWTTDTTTPLGNNNNLRDVATDGLGNFIAVGTPVSGTGTPLVAISSNVTGQGGGTWAIVSTTGLTNGDTANSIMYYQGAWYMGCGTLTTGTGKIMKSTNNGSTWTQVKTLGQIILDLEADLSGTGLVAVAQNGRTLWTNDGANWTTNLTAFYATPPGTIAAYKGIVVAPGADGQLYVSLDKGNSWTGFAGLGGYASTDLGGEWASIAVSPENYSSLTASGHQWVAISANGKGIYTPSL